MKPRHILMLALALAAVARAAAAQTTAPTTRDLEFPVTISDAGVNAFLEKQWNAADFPRSVSGTVLGCQYTLNLAVPTVTFLSGAARLNLSVSVTSSTPGCGGPWNLSLSPTIAIPSGQISVAGVRAFLTDLQAQIDALPIPAWLKTALANEYIPRFGVFGHIHNFIMYPSLLLGKLSSPWFDERTIALDPGNTFSLGWSVVPGALVLKPSARIRSGSINFGSVWTTPTFWVRLVRDASTNGWDYCDIHANIKATVRELIVYTVSGTRIYDVLPNFTLVSQPGPLAGWTKRGGKDEWIAPIWLQGTVLSTNAGSFVWALFEIRDTFYTRVFWAQPNYVSNGEYAWFPARDQLN